MDSIWFDVEEAAEEMQYAEAVLIHDEVQYNDSNPEFEIPLAWKSEDCNV